MFQEAPQSKQPRLIILPQDDANEVGGVTEDLQILATPPLSSETSSRRLLEAAGRSHIMSCTLVHSNTLCNACDAQCAVCVAMDDSIVHALRKHFDPHYHCLLCRACETRRAHPRSFLGETCSVQLCLCLLEIRREGQGLTPTQDLPPTPLLLLHQHGHLPSQAQENCSDGCQPESPETGAAGDCQGW